MIAIDRGLKQRCSSKPALTAHVEEDFKLFLAGVVLLAPEACQTGGLLR